VPITEILYHRGSLTQNNQCFYFWSIRHTWNIFNKIGISNYRLPTTITYYPLPTTDYLFLYHRGPMLQNYHYLSMVRYSKDLRLNWDIGFSFS